MKRYTTPMLVGAAIMFAFAPVFILQAPSEATMGVIAKIIYYHVPSAMAMMISVFVCGIASVLYLFRGRKEADYVAAAAAELVVAFGIIVLVTGPIWARKAWGVWWEWEPRLTLSLLLWMIFVAYLLVRKYGGVGAERLAAGLSLFGMVNVPFVYVSVNIWRTLHPKTTVVMTLPPGMKGPFWFSVGAFALLYGPLLWLRTQLGRQRAELERAYLESEEE